MYPNKHSQLASQIETISFTLLMLLRVFIIFCYRLCYMTKQSSDDQLWCFRMLFNRQRAGTDLQIQQVKHRLHLVWNLAKVELLVMHVSKNGWLFLKDNLFFAQEFKQSLRIVAMSETFGKQLTFALAQAQTRQSEPQLVN